MEKELDLEFKWLFCFISYFFISLFQIASSEVYFYWGTHFENLIIEWKNWVMSGTYMLNKYIKWMNKMLNYIYWPYYFLVNQEQYKGLVSVTKCPRGDKTRTQFPAILALTLNKKFKFDS